ncbi:biosynthetic peptidoglycan transglycosylase [Rhizobacter sp. Root1221]|uniref:biosynthetic peptidoglycan transglycosylase n=1 Tax=Rhizobacter sp. Root1221 TaxID=1736433 RepID=UPI0006FBEA7B|nr:biosynthetic peptidoglycan transglycosylase [Rhizobacter sp. Root1221]KQV99745.1 hypothetical protein ASC87_03375 [Rhizobacter sp. Root1221]
MKAVLKWCAVLVGLVVATVLVLAAAVLHLLRPADGEWAHTVRAGRFSHAVSVPALWRLATHPMVLRLTADRVWSTPFGPVQWTASPQDGQWHAVCAPCSVHRPEWGADTLTVSRAEFSLQHGMEGRASGSVSIGDAPRAVAGRWSLVMQPAGAVLEVALSDVPMADAYGVLAAVVPEARRARIDGRLDLRATLHLPSRALTVTPKVTGFRVAGLGTEQLADARPACPEGPAGTWLPRAVIAAEDQRFHEHTGFDVDALAAAWSANQAKGAVVAGGSTLSQQLAKLVYTGDGRSPARKLRELLYAVELDRTLGKARVLNLYLALVPWGEGQCGAAAAARHYLHKEASKLTPIEAAWLASLLHNPDRERAALARDGHVNVARVDWVMDQMRPPPRPRWRVPAAGWLPPS